MQTIPVREDGVTPRFVIPKPADEQETQEYVLRTLADLMRAEEQARLSIGLMLPNNPAWVSASALFLRVGYTTFAMYCDFMALLQGLAVEERVFLDDDPEHMETLVRVRNVGEQDLQLCARQVRQ
jgi:hypothetical protein